MASPPPHPRDVITLDRLPAQAVATIHRVRTLESDGGALRRRLMELGFVPGERVQVLRRVLFGRGPLAVRVGTSTFAMRELESSLVEVEAIRAGETPA
ncbi:MAG: ferrous iron transport protein A [Burkholderiales bacterium]|nr:ferrous iron transport protein A [Burkholderiales bacterium]MBH2015585.1 ferrous iron transport protein A [Burkholderiales bacterium]